MAKSWGRGSFWYRSYRCRTTVMTSSEYEKYVTKIVRQFDFCKHAKISNNRKFQGKRQPISVAEAHGIALWRVDPEFNDKRKKLIDGILFYHFEPAPEDKAINELYYELHSQLLSAISVDRDGCVNKPRDKYLLCRLYAASIDAILRDAYTQITSHEDWRQVEALKRLAQWEDSSVQQLKTFELPMFEKIPERLFGELLKLVAGDDREAFRSMIKYRKASRAMDWPALPDYLHLHLR